MYLNKTQIIGNLTRDPELKALPSGSKVCNLSMATNHTYKDANGQKQESVEYQSVIFFGKTAETIAQYCIKGQQLYVEGRLQTRNWEKDGVKQYRTEIVGSNFQFGQKPNGKPKTPRNTEEDYEPQMAKSTNPDYPTEDINPDDIPF